MRYSNKFVRPLDVAENAFLQVLLTQFTLRRRGSSTHLAVRFERGTDAIWTRQAKDYLRSRIPRFQGKATIYQQQLNAVLLDQTASVMNFNDGMFPFRYSSGGALPVVRMGDAEFYCLFYRDIHPIGWNIANGGSDSRAELLDPHATIVRELREELIVLNPKRRFRYVFEWEDSGADDRAEFALTRRVWSHAYPDLDIAAFEQVHLPLKWLEGPDTVSIQTGTGPLSEVNGCWLNINATDFGIELDKVAWINVDPDAVFLDGEMLGDAVLDRPVGLFEVDRMDRLIRKRDKTKFLPDVFFHHGVRRAGALIENTISGPFTKSLKELRTPSEVRYFVKCPDKFDLCPVTRSILSRTAGLSKHSATPSERAGKQQRPEVFISCGRGDEPLARQIYQFVTMAKRKSAFFYEEDDRPDWGRRVDDALSGAQSLIVAGTDARRVNRRWPQYEWGSFHNAILSGRKPRTARLIPFLVGVKPQSLPWALQQYKMIMCSNPKAGLRELGRLL